MSLTETEKKALRGRGHALKPVVSIGNSGLSKAVLRELELSLEHHDLMKIKVGGAGRDERREIIEQICARFNIELVQAVGHIALVYHELDE